jgi:hypothetical protein
MTWSYSGDPSASDLDTVRFLLQDTTTADQLMSDEEIQFVIDSWADRVGSNYWAAAMCADNVAAKFAREVAVSGDGVTVAVEALQDKYAALALSLRAQHTDYAGSGPLGAEGNGTIFDVDGFDPTIRPLSFGKGMHDNLRAGQQDFGGEGEFARDSSFNIPEDAI